MKKYLIKYMRMEGLSNGLSNNHNMEGKPTVNERRNNDV